MKNTMTQKFKGILTLPSDSIIKLKNWREGGYSATDVITWSILFIWW